MNISSEAQQVFDTLTSAFLIGGDLRDHVRQPWEKTKRVLLSRGYALLRGSGSANFKQLIFKRDG